MADLYDLGGVAPAAAVSGGLQGLLEAYKMKLSQATEDAKLRQSGFNSNAMMPYRMASLNEKRDHDRATEDIAATNAGSPTAAAKIMARDTLAGTYDPTQAPKRGALYSQYIMELDRQSEGNPDLIAAAQAAKAKMFESGPTAQRVQRSSEALVPLVDNLKKSLGYDPETGAYNSAKTSQSSVPIWNKIKSAFGANVMGGDPRKETKAYATGIQKELNMMAANGGSDKNLALASEMISPDASVTDMLKGIEAAEAMSGGRSTAYGGKNPFPKAPAPAPGPMSTLRAALHDGEAPKYLQTGTHEDKSKWGLNAKTNQWEQIAPPPGAAQ